LPEQRPDLFRLREPAAAFVQVWPAEVTAQVARLLVDTATHRN
jgi:hypothetical protein